MSRLRLAVIGLGAQEGSRARGYLATIARLPHLYELCAVCDRDPAVLAAVGERMGVAARYTDAEAMFAAERPDAVFVLVPTDGQTVFALTAARQGAHVIAEIPYGLTLAYGDAIDRECRERGLKWEIAENVWRWPRERLKRRIIEAGWIGEITHARLSYASGSYHGFNAVRMLIGAEPVRAQGQAGAVPVPPYENYGGGRETTRVWESGTILFPGRVACLYEMPPAPGARGSHWEIEGTRGYLAGNGLSADELVLYQEGRKVRFPFREVHTERDGRPVLQHVRVDTDPPVAWENPFHARGISDADDVAKASILQSLHRAATEGSEPEYGAPQARRDMELWFALRESAARDNTWIDLPLGEETALERRLASAYRERYGSDSVTDTQRLLAAPFDRLSVMWSVAGWL